MMGFKKIDSLLPLFATICLGMMLTACNKAPSENIEGENLSIQSVKATRDMNRYPMNKVVCDPMGDPNTPPKPKNGVSAELAYRAPTQKAFSTSMEYMTKGTKSSQKLFFSDLFVPTRLFSKGFATQTSDVVKDDTGEKLIEYFGIRFRTQLRLTPDQAEGNYELAVLSDDGVTVKAVSGEQSQVLIHNEGDHPTRMGCGPVPISLTRSSAVNLDVTYYQGPRYHISLVMLWRPAQNLVGKDPSCGLTGNDTYFDYNNNSTPKKAYKDLLARGWRPISAENYFLPESEDLNPCTPGSPLTIENVKLVSLNTTSVTIGWTTNRPATSQAVATNTASGEQFMTNSNQMLSTEHTLTIMGLSPATTYTINALSVAEDGAKATGELMTITTPNQAL